jgi:HNH endonuclease
MTKSRHINRRHKRWTERDTAIMRREYPDVATEQLAHRLGRHLSTVYRYAYLLGLKKSAEFLSGGPYNGRMRKGNAERGAAYRFKKGSVPHNKGLRRPGWFRGRMRETWFKKGQRPHTWKPLGSFRLCDGYLQEKVTDTGYPPRDWRPVHVLLWKRSGRRVPRGHVIAFRDGDRTHIALENLVCIPRGELARRNHWTRIFPKELQQVIALRIAIKRKITMRGRNERQHDLRSEKAPVRDARGAQGQGQTPRHRARQSRVRRRRQDHRQRKGRGRLPQRGRRPRIWFHPAGPAAACRPAIAGGAGI